MAYREWRDSYKEPFTAESLAEAAWKAALASTNTPPTNPCASPGGEMKKAFCTLFACLLLLTTFAAGQNPYQLKNLQGSTTDVTTQTNTVNAWKYMGGSCKLGSLLGALSVQWCLGASDNSVYMFDMVKKQWVKQPQFGTSLVSIAAAGPSNVYSLQAVGHCGVYGGRQYYGLFRWIGSWSEDSSLPCLTHVSAAADGSMLAGIGFNSSTSHPALFYSSSNPGGTWPNVSWTFQTDGLISIEMENGDTGCAVDANGGMWEVFAAQSPEQLPALPSGANRAIGCLYAKSPVIAMAWTTTTGSVYAMPLENWGVWQQVTGISAAGVTGFKRGFLFGQDLSGKPYHWNVNAPTVSATFGGQWNTGLGCPDSAHPCNSSATHTISHNMVFKTGHGIGGGLKQTTDVFTHDIEVPNFVLNPSCDPYFGQQADPECIMEIGDTAFCNESRADVQKIDYNYVVADSVDWTIFQLNVDNTGPIRIQTSPNTGYYLGTVTNTVIDGCPVGDPIPKCPAGPEAFIDIKAEWWGPLDQQLELDAAAYRRELNQMAASRLGLTDPYVYHSFYMARQLDNGSLMDIHCFPPVPDTPDDFLNGDYSMVPSCK